MTSTTRQILFFAAAAGLAFVLARAVLRLPPVGDYRGPYGLILNQVAVPQRHVTDVVAAVNFDYRGFDTIGEEYILFASVTGVVLLLRTEQGESESEPAGDEIDEPTVASHAINVVCQLLAAPTCVLGLYIIAHGQLTPGGGFQGGAILASAFLLLFLGGEYRALQAIGPLHPVAAADAIGAAGFVIIGFAGLVSGAAYLQNVLPLGPIGVLYSAGMIPLINLSVGLEVASGFVLILLEFLRQTLRVRASLRAHQPRHQQDA